MKGRSRLRYAVPAALLLVIASAEAAYAGTVLPNDTTVTASSAQDYQYTTSDYYWSVSAVVPSSGAADYLYLYNHSNTLLGVSAYGYGYTNFVAVDSNSGTNPVGQMYQPEVSPNTPGQYWVEAQYGANEVQIKPATHHGTTGFADPDLSYMILNDADVVSISDIYLTAGESFWASTPTAANQLYLLEADPSSSSTWVVNRFYAAVRQHTQVIDNCTLYTAKITGWHALVLVGDTPPTGNNQQGSAIALHQYDPTSPNYCPMADFPGPTP